MFALIYFRLERLKEKEYLFSTKFNKLHNGKVTRDIILKVLKYLNLKF